LRDVCGPESEFGQVGDPFGLQRLLVGVRGRLQRAPGHSPGQDVPDPGPPGALHHQERGALDVQPRFFQDLALAGRADCLPLFDPAGGQVPAKAQVTSAARVSRLIVTICRRTSPSPPASSGPRRRR
jgi:hypothetical protein